jgi:hypothetical protein
MQSRKYVLTTSGIAKELETRVVMPFLEALKNEGELTLKNMMAKSSKTAREAVEGALEKEQQRYESEGSQKRRPQSKELFAASFAALANFIAADTSLKLLLDAIVSTMRS